MNQKELTDMLANASEIYYKGNGETTGLSDTEFDLKLHELMDMEKKSGIVYPNSPTQRVGSDAIKGFAKVKHPIPMLTIENTYDDEGLKEWAIKMNNKYACGFNLSVKYDGVSCELHYKNGVLVSASTRGDKNEGDDITLNAKTIKDIPLVLKSKYTEDKDFYVRGEILMPKSQLAKLNENLEKPFANTRNACSGSIKLLDSKEVAKRGLIFRAWDCYFTEKSDDFHNMIAKYDYLEKLGFKYEDNTKPFRCYIENVISYASAFKNKLDSLNLDYDYDGVVIKINEIEIQDKIGTKDTRAIEWGIARKWNEDYEVWTELQGVEWQVGRTGVVTPVGLLEPVECGGVTISNVTLHNADFVKEIDLHIGNDLRITRSGGVIPYVLEVKHDLLMEMNNAYPKVEIPEVCPVCGGKLVMDGKLLKCINANCSAQIEGEILQFCSKDCCDIKTIGESVVHDLVDKGLINSIIDILETGAAISDDNIRTTIKNHWIEVLGEGYGEKSVDNMLNAIEDARLHIPYERLLGSLSIPNVGKVMARTIANRYMDVFDLIHAEVCDLVEIEGIAEKTANDIVEWIKNGGKEILRCLEKYGWNYEKYIEEAAENAGNKPQPLEGLTVCFTGKSSRFSGDAIEEYLENKGAKCTHSVSKSMNYLITGEKPGNSKVDKASSYGVEIISENEFFEKYNLN